MSENPELNPIEGEKIPVVFQDKEQQGCFELCVKEIRRMGTNYNSTLVDREMQAKFPGIGYHTATAILQHAQSFCIEEIQNQG